MLGLVHDGSAVCGRRISTMPLIERQPWCLQQGLCNQQQRREQQEQQQQEEAWYQQQQAQQQDSWYQQQAAGCGYCSSPAALACSNSAAGLQGVWQMGWRG